MTKTPKIYYTLALNSRDYGTGKNVEKYLYRASKMRQQEPQLFTRLE